MIARLSSIQSHKLICFHQQTGEKIILPDVAVNVALYSLAYDSWRQVLCGISNPPTTSPPGIYSSPPTNSPPGICSSLDTLFPPSFFTYSYSTGAYYWLNCRNIISFHMGREVFRKVKPPPPYCNNNNNNPNGEEEDLTVGWNASLLPHNDDSLVLLLLLLLLYYKIWSLLTYG